MDKIEVLNCAEGDPGFIRLVNASGGDLDIVRAARVSYNADWRSGEDDKSDKKLIRYLLKNHHTSPFEHVVFTFEVKAPIFVFRQWHRHRTWSFNEISARYTELDEGFYVPSQQDITTQSASNKQMRTKEVHPRSHDIQWAIYHSCEAAFKVYKAMIAIGAPRELARGVLPVNAYSRMFATVDFHNLLHFFKLRLHEHSQYEIRVYAEAMANLVKKYVPVSMEVFHELNGEK